MPAAHRIVLRRIEKISPPSAMQRNERGVPLRTHNARFIAEILYPGDDLATRLRPIEKFSVEFSDTVIFCASRAASTRGVDPRSARGMNMLRIFIAQFLRRVLSAFRRRPHPALVSLGIVAALVLPSAARATDAPKMNTPSSFSVSSAGAFIYTIPLAVPPGTAGMAPNLSLDYSSQSGTGLEGLGFTLSGLPAISRCPRTIAQDGVHGAVSFDVNDRFCLEGQRLVKLTAGPSQAVQTACANDHPVEYRTEIDGFSRIASCGQDGSATGPVFFRVWAKSGQVMDFGNSVDSRLHPIGYDHAAGRTGPIAAYSTWGVNRIADSTGNYMLVTYNCAALGQTCTDTDRTQNGQMYPLEITYTANGTALAAYNSVQFLYVDRSMAPGQSNPYPDKTAKFQAGTVQTMTKLLGTVVMCNGIAMPCTANGGTIVRQYSLTYTWDYTELYHQNACCAAIYQIHECDGAQHCLPPITLTWSGHNILSEQPQIQGYNNSTAQGKTSAKPNNFNADFNGDGITDLAVLIPTDWKCPHTGLPTPYFGTNVVGADGWEFSPNDPPPSGPYSTVDYGSNGNVDYNCSGTADFYNTKTSIMDYDGDGYSDVYEHDMDHDDRNQFILHNDRTGNFVASAYLYFAAGPWADYNGDGRSDYVYRPSSPPNTMTPYFSQGNNGSGQASFVSSGVTTVVQDKDYLDAGDFDGDGCADILWLKQQSGNSSKSLTTYCNTANANGSNNCNAAGTNNSFNLCDLPDFPIDLPARRYVLGDFNGDGKTDVFAYGGSPTSANALFLSTGNAFSVVTTNAMSIDQSYVATPGDFNGDGRTDIEFTPAAGHGMATIVLLSMPPAGGGDGVDFVPIIDPPGLQGDTRGTVAADWNSDGTDDLWLQDSNQDQEIIFKYYGPHLLAKVDNGMGIVTTVTYDRINNSASLYTKSSDATYPTQDIDGPFYVVKEVDSGNGINACTAPSNCYVSTYSYAGLKADLTGRGLLGFSSVSVTDSQTGMVQQTNYYTQYPFTGMMSSQTSTCPAAICGTSVVLSQTKYCYQAGACSSYTAAPTAITLSGGEIPRYFLPLRQSIVTAKDIDASQYGTTTTDYTYDCDGGTTPCYGLTASVNVTKQHLASDVTNKLTTNTYYPLTGAYGIFLTNWFVDRLQQSTVTATQGASSHTRTSSFAYDTANGTGLITDEYVEPNDTACVYLHTQYLYDPFGNKTQITTSSYNNACGASHTSKVAFATGGTNNAAFATQMTNPKSQSENWAYDPRFGTPTTHQGPNEILNHLQTSWSYDVFGRKTSEVRPDGNQSFFAYGYCGSNTLPAGESCPSTAKFFVYSVPTNSSGSLNNGVIVGQNGAITISYYDGLARAVASDAQGFDGSWIRVSTVYDVKGRIYQTSRPYCLATGSSSCVSGSDNPHWTTNSYVINATTGAEDPEGRVQLVTRPNGTTVAYTYGGLVTSVSITDPTTATTQTTTTTLDARRNVVKVVDPANKATTYDYDEFENLLHVTAPGGTVVTSYTYDTLYARRKIAMTDPDMGSWTYSYDAYGELVSQTDAKLQTSTLVYDVLGRVIQRKDGASNANWDYDSGANSLGLLHAACLRSDTGSTCAGLAAGDYKRTYVYDTLGRASAVTLKIEGANYSYGQTYNSDGRPYELTYPSGLVTKNIYVPTFGALCRIADDGSPATDCTTSAAQVYWTANQRDQEGRLTLQTAGNGVQTTQLFYPNSGMVEQIYAGPANAVANFSYAWDGFGNLLQRQDTNQNLTENFCYDILNRLKNTSQASASCTAGSNKKSLTYDLYGNITKKSDVSVAGGYAYGANGAGPHALTSIATCNGCTVNGVANPSFVYDANGNMACELAPGQTACDGTAARYVTWTPFNMVSTITQGSANTILTYDSEHARYKQVSSPAGTSPTTRYYLNALGMSEKDITGPLTTWHDFIQVDGRIVADRVKMGSSLPTMSYYTLDHLGSVAVITDDSGAVTSRLSYDAWGRRRNADGTDDPTCSNSSGANHGFTNQEMMDDECLVNLNARIYDPTVGRFLSPDPTVEQLTDLQDLNRYSYVGNNPLSLADPTGLCFLGCFWNHGIFRAIEAIIVATLAQEWALPELEGIQAGAQISSGAAVLNAGISGGLSGYVATGRLSGALYGALESTAFVGVHIAKADLGIGSGSLASAGMHAAVGGLFSLVQGQNFKSGFLAAGFSDLAGSDGSGSAADIARHAVYGGLGAVLGGGKFANGAVTGSFGLLFNDLFHGFFEEPTNRARLGVAVHNEIYAYYLGLDPGYTRGLVGDMSWPWDGLVDLAKGHEIWEIKPDSYLNDTPKYNSAEAQVWGYTVAAGDHYVEGSSWTLGLGGGRVIDLPDITLNTIQGVQTYRVQMFYDPCALDSGLIFYHADVIDTEPYKVSIPNPAYGPFGYPIAKPRRQ
jgi:RHS repeat-associated protein